MEDQTKPQPQSILRILKKLLHRLQALTEPLALIPIIGKNRPLVIQQTPCPFRSQLEQKYLKIKERKTQYLK